MNMSILEELEVEVEEFAEAEPIITEASPATKLSRRRKIEDLFEEKRLKAELDDFI